MGFYFFDLFQILFLLVFGLAVGILLMSLIRGARQWNKNNQSPRLTVSARVVAKRADVSRRRNLDSDRMAHTSSYTTYYVTFEVESGDRLELTMDGSQYGLLVEGDRGNLTFQGTRYLGFQRT